jgi:hypothetical protein
MAHRRASRRAAGGRAALGLKVKTGRAIVVAVRGPLEAPEVLAKTQIDVAFTFEEGAVFHAAESLEIEEARRRIGDAEARFAALAERGLAAFAAGLDAPVVAAALAARAATPPPPLESILASHPLVHAAEGELYRRVFTAASAAIGVRPSRIPPDAAAARIAAAVGLTPAAVMDQLAAMGKASGRPWAADQKQAALAAWVALVS